LVVQPAGGVATRLLDRHRGEPRPGISGSPSETFRLVGTFLMECGMLRGIKARAEQHTAMQVWPRTDLPHFRA
jgi:hypothetical protein